MLKHIFMPLVGAVMAAAGAAQADDVITLKLAHPLPATHYAWEQGISKFTSSVTEKTNGKVKFEVYPANQLGKDSLSLLKHGIADVAMVVVAYAPEKLPLSTVTELPGLSSSSCEGTEKFWNIAKPGGLLAENEHRQLGLHAVFVSTLPPYNLTTISRKVETLEDAGGLKLYAPGAGLDKAARAIGAVPIRITASELFDAVSRGTVDGGLNSYSSLSAYKLDGHLKYGLTGVQFGAASWMLAVSDKTWDSLPEDVRKAIEEAGPASQRELCKWADTDNSTILKRWEAEHGFKVTALSSEQSALWSAKLKTVADDWAKDMDALGKKGSEILEAMRHPPAQ